MKYIDAEPLLKEINHIEEEAHRLIMHTYNSFDIGTVLKRQLTDRYSPLRQDIISDCSKKLLETITLTISKKEDKK